jgi:nucleoside 2-deoxyribosyltransferase
VGDRPCLIYLASPYTPINGESIGDRVAAACRAAAKLMRDGYSVFSPVAHSHMICEYMPDVYRLDHAFWMRQDLAVLRHCDVVTVLKLPGWERSKGVGIEINEAVALGKAVTYMEPV